MIQRDLNLETFEHILTGGYLDGALARLRDRYGTRPFVGRPVPEKHRANPKRDASPAGRAANQAPRDLVQASLLNGPALVHQVEDAVATVRSEGFFDGQRGVAAFEVISQSLALASLPFYPSALSLTEFRSAAPADSSTSLRRAAGDRATNPFSDIFRTIALPDIQRLQPDLVGIAVPTMGQMLAASTLARLIREAGLLCHITAGGPHITMLREALPRTPAFFELFDSAVVFDGEEPLLRLAEELDAAVARPGQRPDLAKVPNLIYRDGTGIRVTAENPAPPLQTRLPDFAGLPLDRYLAPRLVLPLLSSRGCYHGKCAFCNVGYGDPRHYRPLPPDQVVAQMQELGARYGAHHIFFADEAITPRHARVMSHELAGTAGAPHWCGCVRFERSFSGQLLAAMSEGGCRMLLYGLETAAEPMIRRMVKGTDAAEMGRILEEGAAAGLWNHTFFFFGFPGETLEQAQETVNFVYMHQNAVHSASPGAFVLERYSPAYQSPAEYGIRRILADPRRDLAIYFDYVPVAGMDERTAGLVADRFVEALPGKRNAHFYANDTWRFLFASHLREQGQPFPPWLTEEA